MMEDIITALSRFKSLFVIARNSSFIYKGKAVDIEQAGRELGVRYLLEGSVRKAGGKLRITGHGCLRPAGVSDQCTRPCQCTRSVPGEAGWAWTGAHRAPATQHRTGGYESM